MQGLSNFCFCFSPWSVFGWWFPHCCGFVSCDSYFVLPTNWPLRCSLGYKSLIVYGAFFFESISITELLVWIILSSRKFFFLFISSSSKLVSLTCSIRPAKLDVLVCVILVFCMGLQIFLLGFFFAMCSTAENPILSGEGKSSRTFVLFQHLQCLREQPVPFSAENLRLGKKIWECFRLWLHSFA